MIAELWAECVQERNGVWHIVDEDRDRDDTFTPILCGEGIVMPGHGRERLPTCPDCISLAAPSSQLSPEEDT